MLHFLMKPVIWFFFSIWVFFREHSQITGLQGKEEGISLTPHYHFHPLHRHLDISRAITAESSLLHIVSSRTWTEPLVSERKSLTTKLRAFANQMVGFFMKYNNGLKWVNWIFTLYLQRGCFIRIVEKWFVKTIKREGLPLK